MEASSGMDWQVRGRVSRRRLLSTTAFSGLSLAALAACKANRSDSGPVGATWAPVQRAQR